MPQLDRTFDVFASLEEASAAAERLTLELIREAVSSRGSFSVALAGGLTPASLYRNLAQPPAATDIPWRMCNCSSATSAASPPDSPQSNYRMVRETLIQHVPIPARERSSNGGGATP